MKTSAPAATLLRRTPPWLLVALLILSSTTVTLFSHAFVSPRSSFKRGIAHHSLPSPTFTWTSTSSLAVSSLFRLAYNNNIASTNPTTSSALKYASRNDDSNKSGGPMSQVDSTNNSGGCPFLDTSYVYKTYAVPALFSESGT